MPGYADWRTLYHDEYRTLAEEGYPVAELPSPEQLARQWSLPGGPGQTAEHVRAAEAAWEAAYHRLWAVRARGLRPEYPYHEPDDYAEILADAEALPTLEPLDEATYRERVRGAWFGRCAGMVLGKPLEMDWDYHRVRQYLLSADAYPLDDWVPASSAELALRSDCLPSTRGQVRYVQPDDDLHYTIMSLLLVEQHGLAFTTLDVGMHLLEQVPFHWVWGADRQMYYHLVRLAHEPDLAERMPQLRLTLNPWREWIIGQIKADLWGYLTPALPRAGAPLIHRLASLSLTKNGIYGGMFVAGCISAALSRAPSVATILQGGLSVIPKRSRLAEAVRNVMAWYAVDGDWTRTCERIYARYGHLHVADQVNNIALVVLALLHGDLDFSRSITTAVMAGADTDCNGATVGSIVGAAVGYGGLDQHWIAPLNDTVRTVVAGFGSGTISELVERTIALRQRHSEELACTA